MEIEDPNLEENQNSEVVLEPKVGTIFDSEDKAQECYTIYAKAKGFGVITITSKKVNNVKSYVTYGCHRSGNAKPTGSNPVKSHPTPKTVMAAATVGCCSYCYSDQLAVFCAASNMLRQQQQPPFELFSCCYLLFTVQNCGVQ
ncbi:hypothetical protein RHMOL_Rhmol12G0109400 [Rhododendron molle]|uniref:Uncharacterized protein n=1 Tax=Rhododendron molle TaxID=49168 RepID=A0ACC0LIA8_RHOML|nr:hypothetical protein RHMOL_Rhmol12G0109400 [Rhododendron molle]